MLAHDRRTFLRAAGRLAAGLAAADLGIALGQALPPPMDPETALKPCDGDGILPMPAGAIRRLGDPKMRIAGHINALQFSPKGTTLVSASSGELRGWDPRTGKVLFRLNFPNDAWTDSGRLTSKDTFVLLVRPNSGNSNELRHYHFGTGKLLTRSSGLKFDRSQKNAFSVDGTLMAVVHDNAISLHETVAGAEKWKESTPAEAVGDCVFFFDGKSLAVAGQGEIRLYSVENGKLTATLKVPAAKKQEPKNAPPGGRERASVTDSLVSPDGKWLAASVGEDEDTVVCWDVGSSSVKHQLIPAGKPLGFSPDGSELATVHAGSVTFWTVATGRPARMFGVPRSELHLSPDGKVIAAVSGDAAILIDAANGKHLSHSAEPPGLPAALHFAGPHRLLGRLDDWGGWVEWDLKTGNRTLVRPPGVDGLVPVALAADGRLALYRTDKSGDYTARDMATGKVVRSGKGNADANESVATLAMTPDGTTLVSARPDGLAVITDQGSRTIPRMSDVQGMATLVTTDGRYVAVGYTNTGDRGAIDVYDLAGKKYLRRLLPEGEAGHLVFGPDRTRLAVSHDIGESRRGGLQGTVTVFDLRTGKKLYQAEPDQRGRDQQVAFSPDGRWLARVGDEGKIGLIEAHSGQVRARIVLGKDATVTAVAFSPDGRTMAVSMNGGPVFLWDLYAGPARNLSDAELIQTWMALVGEVLPPLDPVSFLAGTGAAAEIGMCEASPAFAAVRRLVGSPLSAIAFLGQKLAPIVAPDPTVVAGHVADLDHREFRKREAAVKALSELGERARDAINQALAANPSPEARERMERLLAAEDRPTPEQLRRLRAIEVVEIIGTPDAARLLARWGGGAPGATFTIEAIAAVTRLAGPAR